MITCTMWWTIWWKLVYIDSGYSCHMTRRKECLRDFINLVSAKVVKFENNNKFTIKKYDKITNGKFSIKHVAYI